MHEHPAPSSLGGSEAENESLGCGLLGLVDGDGILDKVYLILPYQNALRTAVLR